MTNNIWYKFTQDINTGHEEDLNYTLIDKKTVTVLWWNLAVLVFYAVLNSVIKLANYIQSPFSWRVISSQEAVFILIIAFVVTLLPILFHQVLRNHYHYRLLITFCFIVFSYLFIFLSGGAIEAHFHFFIVISYLAIYNDWRLGWFALILISFNHLLLEYLAPHWLFYYGENWLSPLAHVLPIFVAVVFTSILANNNRDVLLAQKETERRKDEFISMASHELKTPITSMMMFIQYIQRSLNKDKLDKFDVSFKRINEQLGKLGTLISDLLDVSRIQGKELAYNLKKYDLNILVNQTVERIRPLAVNHMIQITGKIPKQVILDPNRIEQVLINLLTNAIKYSPKAASITVLLTSSDTKACVAVKDEGIGIDSKQLNKIFKRFYRGVDINERTYPGMGIGLFISKEIVKKHGGQIWVESEKGRGSTFYFTLPFLGADG
jgi:signal transduction histidine kinase